MSETDLANVLKADWAREVSASIAVIKALGCCNACTARPEILSLKLDNTGLANKSLLANLISIENEGHRAFQQAHLDCGSIAVYTYDIGKSGGYIDKVRDSYGKPALEKRLRRALNALDRHVKSAKDAADTTHQVFQEWHNKTKVLTCAVSDEDVSTQQKVEEKNNEVRAAKSSMGVAQSNVTAADKEHKYALNRAEKAEAFARETNERLDTWGPNIAMLGAAMTLSPIAAPVAAAAVPVAVAAVPVAAAATAAAIIIAAIGRASVGLAHHSYREASANKELTLEKLRRCEMDLKVQEEALKTTQSSHLVWKDMKKSINEVLEELMSIQNNVCTMVGFFGTLSDRIKTLVSRYQNDVKDIIDDQDLEEESISDLAQYSQEVKMLCLVVHALSSVYSKMSSDYVIQGFEKLAKLVTYSAEGLSAEEQIKRARGELKIYGEAAQSGIVKLVDKAKMDLLKEVKKVYPNMTYEAQSDSKGMPPAYQPNSLEVTSDGDKK